MLDTTATIKTDVKTRSGRKRKAILDAATKVFVEKGYDGTSMDDVATRAAVSKPTVYKHFQDKSQLYAAIVRSTTDQVDEVVKRVTTTLAGNHTAEEALTALARTLLTTLTQTEFLRLRRMIIANADRFPEVARSWYENGFGKVLATIAAFFEGLARNGILRVEDPPIAANHFVGLVLWIPLNEAMFGGDGSPPGSAEVTHYAANAARAFLEGYRPRS